MQNVTATRLSFNTQPPEGGWPPRYWFAPVARVSTHSRPKAAGSTVSDVNLTRKCFNTQPPEGGWAVFSSTSISRLKFQHTAARRRLATPSKVRRLVRFVSTHSRPKAAGPGLLQQTRGNVVSTHSRPKAAGHNGNLSDFGYAVSTHSRPKAAGLRIIKHYNNSICFNTQPPEGGWRNCL